MGVNSSKQYADTINRTVAENTASIYTGIANTNNSTGTIVQNITLDIQAQFNCQNPTVSQTGKASISGLSEITAEQSADLSAKVMAEYQVVAKQQAEQANKDLSLGQFNVSKQATKLINESVAVGAVTVNTSLSNDIT